MVVLYQIKVVRFYENYLPMAGRESPAKEDNGSVSFSLQTSCSTAVIIDISDEGVATFACELRTANSDFGGSISRTLRALSTRRFSGNAKP